MFEILDLTKTLDENLSIYTEGEYSDPPLKIETWCSVQEQGYKVSLLSMGTQTGTHIDAPAHFVIDGATLEKLPLQALIGQYFLLDVEQITMDKLGELQPGFNNKPILFLNSSKRSKSEISEEIFRALLEFPCLVWVIVYGIQITGHEALYFHKALAQAGKYLIEDVDETTAMKVREDGEMIALPLRLSDTSGSPCRVIVRQSVKN